MSLLTLENLRPMLESSGFDPELVDRMLRVARAPERGDTCATASDWARIAFSLCGGRRSEVLVVGASDAQGYLIDATVLHVGGPRAVMLDAAALLRWVFHLDTLPSKVWLARNHPSGVARASTGDLGLTDNARRICDVSSLGFGAHVVITDDPSMWCVAE